MATTIAWAGGLEVKALQGIELKIPRHVIRIVPGPNEAASIGSYSIYVYDQEGITLVTGLVRPRDGTVEKAWVVEGNPTRLWIWLVSAGSGAFGQLELLELSGAGLKVVPLPEPDEVLLKGYMGHDTLEVIKGVIYRRFPIYKEGDAMVSPSGGKRRLRLDLAKRVWIASNQR